MTGADLVRYYDVVDHTLAWDGGILHHLWIHILQVNKAVLLHVCVRKIYTVIVARGGEMMGGAFIFPQSHTYH